MPLTLKQSCDKLNISKMTLYKYLHVMIMKDHHLATKTYIDKYHRRVLSDDLFKQLKTFVNGKHFRSKPNRKIYLNRIVELAKENKALKDRLYHDNNTARRSINDKRNQISKLNDHINKQDKLLDQQQQLQLSSQHELTIVRKELHTTKNSLLTYRKRSHHKTVKPKHVKHSFWWHLTHKW